MATGSDCFDKDILCEILGFRRCMLDKAQNPGKGKLREFPTQYLSK